MSEKYESTYNDAGADFVASTESSSDSEFGYAYDNMFNFDGAAAAVRGDYSDIDMAVEESKATLEDHGALEWADLPHGRQYVGATWVFKAKPSQSDDEDACRPRAAGHE